MNKTDCPLTRPASTLLFPGLLACMLLTGACMEGASGPTPNTNTTTTQAAMAADTPGSSNPGRVLIIGLDGTRSEGIELADTPAIRSIRSDGFTDLNAITNDVSLSGPGWSSMLSGVWCNKHRVLDNDVTWANSGFDNYPHFFVRAKQAAPALNLVSISHWLPINSEILCAPERNEDCSKLAKVITKSSDLEVKQAAVSELTTGNPHALFIQFDDIDHAGHGDAQSGDPGGFCPKTTGQIDGQCTARGLNSNYLNVIKLTDRYIGEIMAALRARPNFAAENWLVLMSPDHGGGGTVFNQHGFPSAQERRTFFIASGSAARPLPAGAVNRLVDLPEATNNSLPVTDTKGVKIVDIAATALFHLGIPISKSWNIDGQPAGVSGAPPYQEKAVPSCYSGSSFLGDTGK